MRLAVVCFFVLATTLALAETNATSAVAPLIAGTAPPVAPPKVRSIFQACRKDLRTLCGGVPHLQCLTEHRANITSTTCTEWIDGRAACLEDVKKAGCKLPFFQCLSKLEDSAVSEKCATSEFFKSARWRVHRVFRRQRSLDSPRQKSSLQEKKTS